MAERAARMATDKAVRFSDCFSEELVVLPARCLLASALELLVVSQESQSQKLNARLAELHRQIFFRKHNQGE